MVPGAVGLGPRGLYWGAGREVQLRLAGSGSVCDISSVQVSVTLGAWMWMGLCGGRDRRYMVQSVRH